MPQYPADDAKELSSQCDDCSAGAPAANMIFVFFLPEIWSLATTKSVRLERGRRFYEIDRVTGRDGHLVIGGAIARR